MQTVTLSVDGSILEEGRPAPGDPLAYLSHGIALADGFSLRSLFRLLERVGEYRRLSPFGPALLEQGRACPESGCVCDAFDELNLSKTVEMIGFPGQPRLEIYISFHGRKAEETGELKFFPLERLLDMPISLGPLKHVVFGDKMDVFTFDTVYTLFEFIDGILWELSFHGTPDRCELRR